MDRVVAIIPAAGQGKRMNSQINKQFMLLQGMPIIVHTLRVFQASEAIREIVLVCAPGEEEYYHREIIHNNIITKPVSVVTGGKERQDSVFRGLQAVREGTRYVMVHDGARPLITVDLIENMAAETRNTGAVVAGVPVKDTIKRTNTEGIITETLQRENLWHIQTPQSFKFELLLEAHYKARQDGYYGTDEASLVERLGIAVKIVSGSYENIKITTPEDIIVAETIMRGRDKH